LTSDRMFRMTRNASRELSTDGVKQIVMGYHGRKLAAVEPGWKPKPGMLYTQVRAISARINQNYDAWPSDELKKSYRTFLGKPVFVNHANEDPEKARGKVIAARYIESGDDKYVEVIQEVDAKRFPKLAREIREGGLDSVSMGVEAGITKCSYCGNTATDEPEFCEHVRHHKGEYLPRKNHKTGKTEDVLVYENCYKLGFFELSYVFEPADETAVVSRVVMANRRHGYGEIEAPEDIDTLRDEDGESFEDYQFVEPIGHEDRDEDKDNIPFQHWLESPDELQAPDLGTTKRLDREQENEGLDSDRRVEDVEGIGSRPDEDEAMMARQQGRQAMGRNLSRRRVANDEAALIDQAVQELEQYETEHGGGTGPDDDYDEDGFPNAEDADADDDGYPEDGAEDADGYDDDGDGYDEDEYGDEGGDDEYGHGEPDGDEGVYGGEPGDGEMDPRYDDPEAEQRMARRYYAYCRDRRLRPTGKGYRRFAATVGRSASAGNRRGKGSAMGSLSGRGRVAARGRMRHFADDNGFVDGGPYGDNEDQGVQEEVYISQVPPADSDSLPVPGDGTISNTENTLVARRMQKRIKAKAADLQRDIRAYRKLAEDDNIIEPTEYDPELSGTDDQDYKGDFESVQPDAEPTQPKDASVHVFRSFDNWLRSTTGKTARQHGNANFIRRQAASYAKAADIPLDRMFPALDLVLRQARKTEADRRAAMKRRADEKLEVAAPQERIDVETPVTDITDAEAQASQYDLGDFGNNAGDSIADPNLDTDSQIFAPGDGDSGTKSANRKADAVAAVRYAEAYINAGLPHRDKWQLVAQAQQMRHATVVDRTRVLEAVVSANTQRAASRKVAAAVSRGTANGLPRGLTNPRTAGTSRTAANDPSNDIGMWL